MKSPDGTPDTKTIRKIAARTASEELDDVVFMWPAYIASRRSLELIIAEAVGLPWEHRRRAYYKLALLTAMNAYDSRMAERRRKLMLNNPLYRVAEARHQEGRR